MATRKAPPRKATVPSPPAEAVETHPESARTNEEPLAREASGETANLPPTAAAMESAALAKTEDESKRGEHEPRFHFFIIDAGWKSNSAQVIRENFHMIREFQNHDPLYILTREQSIQLIRANPDLIGKDPVILVHDLHAKGGRGVSGYHGFRLCLGLIKDTKLALQAMQEFLRFIHAHRRSADIEKDIKEKLHRAGLEGAIDVLRDGAQEMVGG